MISYKRNQIQDAIAALDPEGERTDAELLTRMKRLLEADRALGRSRRSRDPEHANFAFYSEEPQGTGVEVWFTPYEAFALFTALRVLEHGFPQGMAVRILRSVRPELQIEHAAILRRRPESTSDRQAMREKAKPGTLAVGTAHPVFLTILRGKPSKAGSSVSAAILREPDVGKFIKEQGWPSWSQFELAAPARLLADALAKTEPRKRGRSSS